MQVVCKCKPSLFAYPKPVTAESNKVAVTASKAVLSTTARAKKREADKKAAEKPEGGADAGGPSGVFLIILTTRHFSNKSPALKQTIRD